MNNLSAAAHVFNIVALLAGSIYFVTRVESANLVLAERLMHISDKFTDHAQSHSHKGANRDLSDIAVSIEGLRIIVESQHRDLVRIEKIVQEQSKL